MGFLKSIGDAFRQLVPAQSPVQDKSWGEATMSKLLGQSSSWGAGQFGGSWDRQELANHYRGFNYLAIQPLMKEISGMTPHAALRHDGYNIRQARQKAMYGGNWTDLNALNTRYLSAYDRQKAIAPIQTHEELEPVSNDHPVIRLLRNPNGPDTAASFFRKLIMFWRLYGEFYIWLVPPRIERLTGQKHPPVEMWVLPSHWVWPKHDPDHNQIFKEFEIRPYAGNFPVESAGSMAMSWYPGGTGRAVIPSDQMVYYFEPNPSGFMNGYSPLTAISHWIDCSDSIDRSRTAQFQNGAFPGVVLEFDKGVAEPDKATIERLEARIVGAYAGVRRNGRTMILSPGVKMRPLDNKPYEMSYTESADQIKDWVFAAQGTGQSIVGLVEQTTFNNVWGARANFYSNTIRPACQLLGEIFTEKIARRFDERMVVYWPDTTPVDPDLRLRELDTMLKSNVLTVNEVCAILGYAPKPWGDEPLDKLRFGFQSQATGGAQQPAQGGQQQQVGEQQTESPADSQSDQNESSLPTPVGALVDTARPLDDGLSVSPLHSPVPSNRLQQQLAGGQIKPGVNGKHRKQLENSRLR